jgi:hypothetical protein
MKEEMKKKAEAKAIEKYPAKNGFTLWIGDINEQKKEGYIQGYTQAILDKETDAVEFMNWSQKINGMPSTNYTELYNLFRISKEK